MKVVKIDGAKIVDSDTFHDVFYEAFGFPGYYGRNRDAWIDCMSSLDSTMNGVQIETGDVVTLHIENAKEFKEQYPDLFGQLIEDAGFVNFRRIERNEPAILALSFNI